MGTRKSPSLPHSLTPSLPAAETPTRTDPAAGTCIHNLYLYKQTDTNTDTQTYMYIYLQVDYIQPCILLLTCTHMYPPPHMYTHVSSSSHVHTCILLLTCTHMYPPPHMYTHVSSSAHVHTCILLLTCTHMYPPPHVYTHVSSPHMYIYLQVDYIQPPTQPHQRLFHPPHTLSRRTRKSRGEDLALVK
jgi:hypothetical protein